MINNIYRLSSPKQFRIDFIDEKINSNNVVIRPCFLSICAADQRYYSGNRSKEALLKKLPMALIHEAVGEILYDPLNEFKVGDKVVMIPNTPFENDPVIKENYLRSSKFRSSGYDGFMQSIVSIRRDRVIKFNSIDFEIASLLELMSVCVNTLKSFINNSHIRKEKIGVWGCGSVGFVMALVLKNEFPDAKIIVFDKSEEKLNYFSFVDEKYVIDEIPNNLKIDHAFECVGGMRSEDAVEQIIGLINPEGTICLMGVSESLIPINTRMILEKGLKIIGNSRSSYDDFNDSIKILEADIKLQNYLKTIVSDKIVVRTLNDIHKAFELDSVNNYKTIMKWEI